MSKITEQERTEAITRLTELFPRGSYVSTVRMWRNRNGDKHDILVLAPYEGSTGIARVSYMVAMAGVGTLSRRSQAVTIGGGGLDPAYALVDSLSRTLYGEGNQLRLNAL